MQKARILIVEDDEIIRDFLQDSLEMKGFTPLWAENGLEALQTLEREEVDLVLSDVRMPEIDGIEHSIVSNIPPAKMAGFGRFMLGAASRPERVAMVTGMRQAMPAEAFDGLLAAIMGETWRFGDWERMEQVLC